MTVTEDIKELRKEIEESKKQYRTELTRIEDSHRKDILDIKDSVNRIENSVIKLVTIVTGEGAEGHEQRIKSNTNNLNSVRDYMNKAKSVIKLLVLIVTLFSGTIVVNSVKAENRFNRTMDSVISGWKETSAIDSRNRKIIEKALNELTTKAATNEVKINEYLESTHGGKDEK